jgi:hypothetical protein
LDFSWKRSHIDGIFKNHTALGEALTLTGKAQF